MLEIESGICKHKIYFIYPSKCELFSVLAATIYYPQQRLNFKEKKEAVLNIF